MGSLGPFAEKVCCAGHLRIIGNRDVDQVESKFPCSHHLLLLRCLQPVIVRNGIQARSRETTARLLSRYKQPPSHGLNDATIDAQFAAPLKLKVASKGPGRLLMIPSSVAPRGPTRSEERT